MGLMRPPHVIKPNKNTEMPAEVIFFDCETEEERIDDEIIQHNLRLGIGCHLKWHPEKTGQYEDWLTFYRPTYFWEWALKQVKDNRRMVFIAHNLDFDFLVLNGISELTERDYHMKTMISSGKIDIWVFVQYKYKPDSQQWNNYINRYGKRPRVTRTLLFLDLMNYFDTSLKEVGKSVGCHKLPIDFKECSIQELSDYCKNDVFIMVEAWKKWLVFIHENDLGVWGKTLPSQAFNAYRHRFMPHKIRVHTHEKATALERAGYFGGRCECFQLGYFDNGPFYLFDINSMYPSVMKSHPYPVKLLTYVTQGHINDLTETYADKCFIATILVRTTVPRFPKRREGRLVFPVGTFWTVLSTPELWEAIENRAIIAMKDFAVYEPEHIFKDYIDFFWTQRLEYKVASDAPFIYMCKILMNSLYGKFGQKIDNYEHIGEDPEHGVGFYGEYDIDTKKWLKFRKMNGYIDISTGQVEGYNSFVAISAHVTSYARSLLWSFIQKIPSRHLFYCDTDSLIVDEVGRNALWEYINDVELGALHLEKESDTITIFNAKDYIFADKRKIKGVRTTAKKIDAHTFGQWQQRSLKRVLWNEQPDNCQWKWVEKTLREGYKKGTVDDYGVIHPLVLNETV